MNDDITFTGYQENRLQYVLGFDLLVLRSTNEGFSLSLAEALNVALHNRISSGGTPEILKYDQLLFEPRDVDGLATKISDFAE